MHWLDARGIAGNHIVNESLRVGSDDLDLPFNGDVPQRDVIDEGVVFDHCAPVFGLHEAPRVIHPVVDCRPPAPGFHGKVPVG